MTACRFRDARHAALLTVDGCADLLRVSERTVRNWESGSTRIPYTAYKLLRVLKGGRYLAHPHWQHFVVRGATLYTPEGHRLDAGDLAWWSLLVRRARAFSQLRLARDLACTDAPQQVASETSDAGATPAATVDLPTVCIQKYSFSPVGPVESGSVGGIGPSSNTGQKGHDVRAGGAA